METKEICDRDPVTREILEFLKKRKREGKKTPSSSPLSLISKTLQPWLPVQAAPLCGPSHLSRLQKKKKKKKKKKKTRLSYHLLDVGFWWTRRGCQMHSR